MITSSTTAPENAVIALFKKTNPDITVKVAAAPGATYSQVVSTQLAGGQAGDIIRAYPGNGSNLSVVQGSDKGFFADLSKQPFASTLPSSLTPVLKNKGKLYAVPVTTSAIGGVYNMGVLDKIGVTPPTTWDQVLSYCSKAKAAGVVPYGLGLKDAWTGQFVSYALAATLLPADIAQQQAAGKATFSNSAWKTVFQKYDDMKTAGCFTAQPNGTSYADVEQQIAQGATGGTISLSDTIQDVQKISSSAKMDFAAFPATNKASQTKLSTGLGVVLVLNAKSKNTADAEKLLQFFTTPAAQAAYSKAAGTSPALSAGSAFKNNETATTIQKFTTDNKTAAWPDQQWPNPNVQQVHFNVVQGMFAGSETPGSAVQKLDAAYKG